MILFLALLVAAVALTAVAVPFFLGVEEAAELPALAARKRPVKELKEEKARMLLAIRELDFDYETGKLSPADYKSMRDRYESQTVELMKKIEDLEARRAAFRAGVEAEIRKRLGAPAAGSKKEGPACTGCSRPLSPGDRFCSSCGAPVASGFCGQCGAPLKPGARFCGGCGSQAGKVAYA